MIQLLSAIAVILSLLGQYLVAKKRRSIFVIWGVSNIIWILVDVVEYTNWYQILMYFVFILLNINGWINWKRDEQRDCRTDRSV